jgi:DNA-binding transcriptional MocR family regulator
MRSCRIYDTPFMALRYKIQNNFATGTDTISLLLTCTVFITMEKNGLLYMQIAGIIEQQIKNNVLKIGDKLPSLRVICNKHGVSMSTALQSYFHLEKKGLIESRPQSGYFISYAHRHFPPTPDTSKPRFTHGMEDIEHIIATVSENASKAKLLLSSGAPAIDYLPVAKLNKAMITAVRTLPDSGVYYDYTGNLNLKRQIARRSLLWGGNLKEQDIISTSGCMEALAICMQSLASRGDTIAVESPVFHGILQYARHIGLNVLELPTNSTTGVEIDALKKALEANKIKLCLLVSNFSNPLGSCMPNENKKEVVRLMEKHNVPLIEDDLYGDLYFGDHRPKTCKSFDESGIVLYCGSFSKTLAPGYRVGWVAPGKFKEKIRRTKRYHSVACNTLSHEAVGSFLENGRYDNHLRKLRQTLHANSLQFRRCISEYFPDGTRVSRPQGGFILWVEMNKGADVMELYDLAIQQRISISPGCVYTLQKQYNNCFRLSYGLLWNAQLESGLKTLGRLATKII